MFGLRTDRCLSRPPVSTLGICFGSQIPGQSLCNTPTVRYSPAVRAISMYVNYVVGQRSAFRCWPTHTYARSEGLPLEGRVDYGKHARPGEEVHHGQPVRVRATLSGRLPHSRAMAGEAIEQIMKVRGWKTESIARYYVEPSSKKKRARTCNAANDAPLSSAFEAGFAACTCR